MGQQQQIVAVFGGFATALARDSDLIASVPERHTGKLQAGMHSFPLPVTIPEITSAPRAATRSRRVLQSNNDVAGRTQLHQLMNLNPPPI